MLFSIVGIFPNQCKTVDCTLVLEGGIVGCCIKEIKILLKTVYILASIINSVTGWQVPKFKRRTSNT